MLSASIVYVFIKSPCPHRLEDLQSLAEKILSECDTAETGLDEVEEKIKDFEENSTPGDAAKLSSDIKDQIKVVIHVYKYPLLYDFH